ncbi:MULTISPECIES: spore coat protein SP96 [Gordonibacter]|uniref:Spore coat protein SP96 n=1 Tax=Gordonibacter faecis TaxID=3047475 RepID=A0ABT7DK04_9ACTN|nr:MULTISPECIES: spore coat protein SP96 [unclassified Gordonibacter]MDJ1649853.1 spore coat protein SP96 [Gordonibacter sp. KGMB12511]
MAENMNPNDQGVPTPPPAETPDSATQVPPTQVPPTQPYQQPPMGQMPPQQPYQAPAPGYQPQPQPPVYMPAPLMELTGGMKFGWFAVGALLGIPGIVISWLVNVDKLPQVKSDALKWTIIGFVAWIVIQVLLWFLIGGMIAAAMAGVAGSYGGGYYHGSW